ncbi:MAG: histidine-type phosphatase [Bacteroidales bacterium]|nr:histidine-type phosphatase [Bacteroidales bacterium]
MKKTILLVISVLFLGLGGFAQDKAREDSILAANPNRLFGYNDVIRPDEFEAPSKAPKGYEPFYIAHYGRHGSRFAWSKKTYTLVDEVLKDAKDQDNLTDFGLTLQAAYEPFAALCFPQTGDLTRKGWNQHNAIAKHMYKSYPRLFKKNPSVFAASSNSHRAMMSMQSFCLGLKECDPKLDLYAQMSSIYFDDCIPESGSNPNKLGPQDRIPRIHAGEIDEYTDNLVDTDAILKRIFKDIDKLGDKKGDFLYELYLAYIGQNSLDFKANLPELITYDELLGLYKSDCVYFYHETRHGLEYANIIKRLIVSADEALASDRPSVNLRFGHDYVLDQYLSLAGVNNFGKEIPSIDYAYVYYPVREIPMGCNVQFVFYKSKKSPDVLVKVVLNGKEGTLPVEPVSGHYYKWSDYKAWLTSTVLDKLK